MSLEEMQELLSAKGWSRTNLASALNVTENAVHQWMSGRRRPGGPASILMRLWLDEARASKKLATAK